jgi:hypothetical protein
LRAGARARPFVHTIFRRRQAQLRSVGSFARTHGLRRLLPIVTAACAVSVSCGVQTVLPWAPLSGPIHNVRLASDAAPLAISALNGLGARSSNPSNRYSLSGALFPRSSPSQHSGDDELARPRRWGALPFPPERLHPVRIWALLRLLWRNHLRTSRRSVSRRVHLLWQPAN